MVENSQFLNFGETSSFMAFFEHFLLHKISFTTKKKINLNVYVNIVILWQKLSLFLVFFNFSTFLFVTLGKFKKSKNLRKKIY